MKEKKVNRAMAEKSSQKNWKKFLFYPCISLVLLCVLAWGGLHLYASDYYPAEEIAVTVLAEGNLWVQDHLTVLPGTSEIGIIFYPGALVEAIAYLPLLQQLQQRGFTCVLVEMPYHLAIFNQNGAEDVFHLDLPVSQWYMAGHSLGGVMASGYASAHPDKIQGLLLLGAYVYGSYPPEKSLTIYGSYNDNIEEKMNYTENIIKIEGGNHAKFGNYGAQKGDPEGDITREAQQQITVDAIVAFVGLDSGGDL